MDVAYDHIQEEALASGNEAGSGSRDTQQNLNAELGEAFKAVSSSAWGVKLGGWFGQVRKQGESFYQDLQKEASEASEQAAKGFTSLREQVVSRTRGLSLNAEPSPLIPGEEGIPEITTTDVSQAEAGGSETAARAEALSADIVREAGSLVASLRLTAAAKLKDIQKAEDAADEALLKFGTNVRNFLRDAVKISAPGEGDAGKPKGTDGAGNEVLFETQEPSTGKKVFHTTRLDAQLHAIHTATTSFTQDPQGDEWEAWQKKFDIEKQTDAITADLDKHEELRRAMEKLVPEKVEYKMFWMRYYFLREAVQEEERRRKEVLKDATAETQEEVRWDDDEEEEEGEDDEDEDDDEEDEDDDEDDEDDDDDDDDDDDEDDDESDEESVTPQAVGKAASASTTTLNAPANNNLLKPKSPRRSEDEKHSVAGSDASYDIVSGATSRAMGSPKEDKTKASKDESDDDWE